MCPDLTMRPSSSGSAIRMASGFLHINYTSGKLSSTLAGSQGCLLSRIAPTIPDFRKVLASLKLVLNNKFRWCKLRLPLLCTRHKLN